MGWKCTKFTLRSSEGPSGMGLIRAIRLSTSLVLTSFLDRSKREYYPASKRLPNPAGWSIAMFGVDARFAVRAVLARCVVLLGLVGPSEAQPLPDMVVYGRLPPGRIEDAAPSAAPRVLARVGLDRRFFEVEADTRWAQHPGAQQVHYTIRIPRKSGEVVAGEGPVSIPGDEVRVFIDRNGDALFTPDELTWVPSGKLVVSGQERSITRLDLDQSLIDGDRDGLPDAWEIANFGDMNSDAHSCMNHAGVTNLMALAMGLDPNVPDLSLLPRLTLEPDGSWSYHYALAAAERGIHATLMESASLAGPWLPSRSSAVDDGTWDGRTLMRHRISPEPGKSRWFFRLNISAGPLLPP